MAAAGGTASQSEALTAQQRAALQFVRGRVGAYQQNSCHWRKLVGESCVRSSNSAKRTRSVSYALWVLKRWKIQAKRDHNHARHWMVKRTKAIVSEVDEMRQVMGYQVPDRRLASASNVEAAYSHARHVRQKVRAKYVNPPEKKAFLCIHRYEGSWTDKDSGANGHYGGVQFGRREWLRFGYPYSGESWAYQADEYAQLWAAHRYYQVSGFNPWPQTARNCGLL